MRHENGIGDNIALVQELEPGTGFAESVYRLSGAPSVVARPVPAPVVRQPPQMPAQAPEDVRRGRSTSRAVESVWRRSSKPRRPNAALQRRRGVLFVGRNEHGTAWNITRRAVDASEVVQKRDLRGTDKRHPQMLFGGLWRPF